LFLPLDLWNNGLAIQLFVRNGHLHAEQESAALIFAFRETVNLAASFLGDLFADGKPDADTF